MITATASAAAHSVPGFIESEFNPLVFQVAEQCLSGAPGDGTRTAVVLGSLMGDTTTTDLASTLLIGGQVNNPLLFMQATANAILGYLSREFAITGPLLALSTTADLGSALLSAADLLLDDTELDRVLVIGVELAGKERTAAVYRELDLCLPTEDLAVALLIDRAESIALAATTHGDLRQLAELVRNH
jgi:3-oxoacyl-(acyl-carrier-protein) synthase